MGVAGPQKIGEQAVRFQGRGGAGGLRHLYQVGCPLPQGQHLGFGAFGGREEE
jgi:hypothetical protein